MKWLKLFGLGVLASLAFSPKAQACSSAKPMGRGGTNVAVADDASAVYWNPAGLVQLERPELDITKSPNNRYKGFLCYAQPLNDKSAAGLNFCYRRDRTICRYKEYKGNLKGEDFETFWLKFSYSRKLTDNFSSGANLTIRQNYRDEKIVNYTEGSTLIDGDVGFLYKLNDKIKLGLLLQGFGNCTEILVPNVRPGVSVKLDKTLLAFEGYDVAKKYNLRHFRCGLERKVNDRLSVRGGLRIKSEVSPSLGLSYRRGDLETSVSFTKYNLRDPALVLSLNKKF